MLIISNQDFLDREPYDLRAPINVQGFGRGDEDIFRGGTPRRDHNAQDPSVCRSIRSTRTLSCRESYAGSAAALPLNTFSSSQMMIAHLARMASSFRIDYAAARETLQGDPSSGLVAEIKLGFQETRAARLHQMAPDKLQL